MIVKLSMVETVDFEIDELIEDSINTPLEGVICARKNCTNEIKEMKYNKKFCSNRCRKAVEVGRWQKKNKEHYNEYQRLHKLKRGSNTERKLKLAKGEADILRNRASCCEICGTKTPGGHANKFAIDHVKGTKIIRGILCLKCNSGIGSLNHDVKILKSAIRYLERSSLTIR